MTRKFFQWPRGGARWRLVALGVIAMGMITARLWFFGLPSFSGSRSSPSRPFAPAAMVGPSPAIEQDGQTLLPAGPDPSQHFDVSEFRLNPEQLHYGLGREHFPAMIEPEFITADEADDWLADEDRVLVAQVGQTVHVYPVELMIRHEVVNDQIEGVPIFAAYCILAELGAVYDRRLDDQTLTFAVSGYTYFDPEVWEGRDAFVLWDRETESLWWPPIGKAVSGPLIDTPMKLLDKKHWSQTSWGEVKRRYPDAKVLERGQDFERPTEWPRLTEMPATQPVPSEDDSIAPHWGENAELAR